MGNKIEELISSREKFNDFVYTSLDEAVRKIRERSFDKKLLKYIETSLSVGCPKIFEREKCAVLFRQIATPNYEFRRFISLVDGMDSYTPVIIEYYNDKFVDKNEFKYYLGMIPFFLGRGKKGGEKITLLNVIDFNNSRGKKLSEIKTVWGETLINFHHNLLTVAYKGKGKPMIAEDVSEWFQHNGNGASLYYKNYLTLFLQNNILFENFMLDSKELSFTRDIFLPAFIKIFEETDHKPLVVALEPTEVESDVFWMCHPAETMGIVRNKLDLTKNPI